MQQVNVRALVEEINYLLGVMDERFTRAKQAWGVRPDLRVAGERIADAGATVMELVQLVNEMQTIGISQPQDVIDRINTRYAALHVMAEELDRCRTLVHVRSHSGRPQSTLN